MVILPRGWKRIGLFGDTHDGHKIGLTPKAWQYRSPIGTELFFKSHSKRKICAIQQECYNWWQKKVKQAGPFHLAIINGDCIDGKGERSKGTELITADRDDQVAMAITALSEIEANNWTFTFGTPYHTGMGEDFEIKIAEHFNVESSGKTEIGAHQWPQVNGWTFDAKHFVGSSGVPYGRGTAPNKDDTWNALWAVDDQMQPRADFIIRSHVHYYLHQEYVRGKRTHHVATLPALQAMGSKFGSRKCTGRVDFGFCYVDVPPKNSKEQPIWRHEIAEITAQRAHVSAF